VSPLFSGLSGVHRNDVVFEKKQFISSMQATFRGMYWQMRFGALMQREDEKQTIRPSTGSCCIGLFHQERMQEQ
jgi:hypothetical protein